MRVEFFAGLTTFVTMSYIILLNPNLLAGSEVGSPLWNGIFMATCLASAIGTIAMAFLANKPYAMAPGMGLNGFFAVVVANIAATTGMTYTESYQAAIIIILIEGIIFFILSIFNVRDRIVKMIPYGIRVGIAPAIGLLLISIGLGSNVSVFSETGGPFYILQDFFGSLTAADAAAKMGSGFGEMLLSVIAVFHGVCFVVILNMKKYVVLYRSV